MKIFYFIIFGMICLQGCAQTSNKSNQPSYWLGRSTGKLPQLSYSLGADRLGSAKLGYIDTGIMLKIVDSANDLYKVQLSKLHSAYMSKTDVQRDTTLHEKDFYLTGNWNTSGGKDKYDTVLIHLNEKLPYKSWMEIEPSKIKIDIYGVQSNTNWIVQKTSLKEIRNIYFNQIEDDEVEATIDLQHKQHWGYTIKYNGNILMILIKKQPFPLNIQNLKIAIDAGHGGENKGTPAFSDTLMEKDYTLMYAKALENYLRLKKINNVIMTRTTDTTFSNTDRVLWLQQQQPDLLISVHFDASNDTAVNGAGSYYKDVGFRKLSTSILKHLIAAGMKENANVGNFNFLLNQPTDFSNVLLEIGFLTNAEDEKKIMNSKFRAKVVKAIYTGIVDFLNEAK